MSAIVKIGIDTRMRQYTRIVPADGVTTTAGKGYMSILLHVEGGTQIGGKSAGQWIDFRDELKTGQALRIDFGTVEPTKYPLFFSVNPALARHGLVSSATTIDPGEKVELSFTYHALEPVDLSKFGWLGRLHAID